MKSLLSFFLSLLLATSVDAQAGQKELDPTGFANAIAAPNVQVLDVRTAAEFRSGHIKNALQADWNDKKQFADRTQYLDKTRPLYVYCLSGGRSAAAAEWLRKNGYPNVYELKGGILQWKNQHQPLEGKSTTAQMTLDNYQSLVKSHAVVLVDFGAEWCPPCKKMEPVLNALHKESGSKYHFLKVDGGNDVEVMKANNVEALPVFIIYKNGKEVWRKQGLVSKEELQKNL